mgnify:CR=1 FL=1
MENQTKVQIKQQSPFDAFRVDLNKLQTEIKKLLPEHISIERFERVVLTAIQMNPDLLNKDRKSLFNACLRAASDGLLVDGREAAIVPFKDQAQYMPMTYGIIKKMRNSGELSTISANIIHENDEFDYFVDQDGEHFTHKPKLLGERGEAIGVYSMVKTKDGGLYFDVMNKNEVMAIRNVSRSKNNSPWDGPFSLEMWKKSSIRRLSKRVPMSAEVERVIQANDDWIDFNQTQIESKAEKIQNLITQKPIENQVQENLKLEPENEEQGEFEKFNSSFIVKSEA